MRGLPDIIQKFERDETIMEEKDRKARANNSLVGRYIEEQHADGYAFYEIVKENTKTVKIKHLKIWDAWVIPYWGLSATIDKKYVKDQLQYRESLEKLFQRRQK